METLDLPNVCTCIVVDDEDVLAAEFKIQVDWDDMWVAVDDDGALCVYATRPYLYVPLNEWRVAGPVGILDYIDTSFITDWKEGPWEMQDVCQSVNEFRRIEDPTFGLL